MKTKSALSYFGSDSKEAADLAAMLEHCRRLTIPIVGGASILSPLEARAIIADDPQAHSRIRAAANDLNTWARQAERCEWMSECFRTLIGQAWIAGDGLQLPMIFCEAIEYKPTSTNKDRERSGSRRMFCYLHYYSPWQKHRGYLELCFDDLPHHEADWLTPFEDRETQTRFDLEAR